MPAASLRIITWLGSRTVIGVLLTNHVLSGALIGALARRPAPAFAAGVASHFVLDALPHWGDWGSIRRFLQVAVPDGLIGLAATGLVILGGVAGMTIAEAVSFTPPSDDMAERLEKHLSRRFSNPSSTHLALFR